MCTYAYKHANTCTDYKKITLNIEEDLRPGNSSSGICCFCRVPFLSCFNKEKRPCITTRFKMKEKVLIAMRLLEV